MAFKNGFSSRMDTGIAKTDASVFFPISKEMDGKEVILVFDDLERCRIVAQMY